jgi:hypothetical protein
MEPADSAALLAWCRNTTSAAAAFVLYEQICPDSAFGQQMLINLEVRSPPPPQKNRLATLQDGLFVWCESEMMNRDSSGRWAHFAVPRRPRNPSHKIL